jgi:hypothetical protein
MAMMTTADMVMGTVMVTKINEFVSNSLVNLFNKNLNKFTNSKNVIN